MSAIDNIINGTDEYGNTYYAKDGRIYLKLEGSDRTRCIGLIKEEDEKVLYMKHEEEDQRYRKTDAWSINWHVAKFVDLIFFITDREGYKISRRHAEMNGEFLHFQSSTEKKLYVPVKYWTKRSEVV